MDLRSKVRKKKREREILTKMNNFVRVQRDIIQRKKITERWDAEIVEYVYLKRHCKKQTKNNNKFP